MGFRDDGLAPADVDARIAAALAANVPDALRLSGIASARASIASGVDTYISFATSDYALGSITVDSTLSSIGFTKTGIYQVSASLTFGPGGGTAATERYVGLYLLASPLVGTSSTERFATANTFPPPGISGVVSVSGQVAITSTTQSVSLFGFQSSGAAIALGRGYGENHLSVQRLGPLALTSGNPLSGPVT